MSALWQQIFALDVRCNSQRCPNNPNFRGLYIRRRNQLLSEAFKGSNLSFRRQYLKIRAILIQQNYGVVNILGPPCDQISIHSKNNKCSKTLNKGNDGNALSKPADPLKAVVGATTTSENYAFVGVHHIYDQHIASVVMVKFANNDRTRLCCASSDGTLSLCSVINNPPTVEFILREHEKAVTGFDWSLNNDLVVSCSLDCSVRLWDSYSGKCLRVVNDEFNSEVLCCVFQPTNNNMIIAGNSKGIVYVLNISAGIYPKGGFSKIGGRVLSISCSLMGNIVWAGNDKGVIVSFLFEPGTGKLQKRKKIIVANDRPITCLSWRAWTSKEARDPALLVNCAANVLCLYRVEDSEGNLRLKKKFNIRHKSELIRSIFCPIISFRHGACVVSGSEDSCVYFFDIEREKPIINKLQGHACPVLGVSFNYDESLLATSDVQGLVIIWKREV